MNVLWAVVCLFVCAARASAQSVPDSPAPPMEDASPATRDTRPAEPPDVTRPAVAPSAQPVRVRYKICYDDCGAKASGTQSHWYGWQIMTTDAVALVFGAIAADAQSGALFGVGGATYLLGGPVVHWAHDNIGKGFGSLGLRVGVPLLFGGIGAGVSDSGGGEGLGQLVGFIVGAGIGMIPAAIIDWAVLAYEPVTADEPLGADRVRATKPALSLAPNIVVARDGTTVVTLRGAF